MTEFLRSNLEIYFIENPAEADKIADQVLVNKRSREQAEKTRLNIKKKLAGTMDIDQPGPEVRGLPQQRPGCAGSSTSWRAIPPSAPANRAGIAEFQAIMPGPGQDLELPQGRLQQDLEKRHHHRPDQGAGLWRGTADPEQRARLPLT